MHIRRQPPMGDDADHSTSDEWDDVDPTMEASLRMASDLGLPDREAANDAAAERPNGIAPVSDEAADLARMIVLGSTEFIVDSENERASGDDSGYESSSSGGSSTTSNHGHGDGIPRSTRVSSAQADEHAAEEDGMGPRYNSAQMSWAATGSAVWQLRRILRRRTQRARLTVEELEDVVPSAVLGWDFLCEWEGNEPPSWEHGMFLLEAGHLALMLEFDEEVKRAHTKKPPSGGDQTKPPSSYRVANCRRRFVGEGSTRTPYRCMADTCVALFDHMGDTQQQRVVRALCPKGIATANEQFGYVRDSVRPAVTPEFARFYASMLCLLVQAGVVPTEINVIYPKTLSKVCGLLRNKEAMQSLVPVLLFHGTRARAVGPISAQGLRVPGLTCKNVKVVNGSASGVGIYSASDCRIPMAYAHSGDLFVCIGLVPTMHSPLVDKHYPKSTKPTVNLQGVHVFYDESLIAPFLHVKVVRAPVVLPSYLRDALALPFHAPKVSSCPR
jgi:hypothetical protein